MTDQLPWDRFGDPAVQAAADATEEQGSLPSGPEPDDELVVGLSDTEEELRVTDLAKDFAEEVLGYLKESLGHVLKGETVDLTSPTITAVDHTGRELVVADAKSRSWRTLVQGLAFDVMAAVIAAVAMLAGLDPLVKETWITFGILLVKSVVSAIISYFMRLRITPTIRTEGEKMNVAPLPVPIPQGQGEMQRY